MTTDAVPLTEAQAAVYDRQLRVWGVEVQNRLTAARILIAGGCGLSAEVAKNLVLAGVGHVTVSHDTPCASAPFGNFLVPADADPTSSVAEACATTLQAMNPLVKVVSVPGNSKALAESCCSASQQADYLLEPYDLVLATGLTWVETKHLDAKCTELGKKLFVSSVRGPVSHTWVNLQKHTFTEKNKSSGSKVSTQPLEQTAEYPSLSEALSTPNASLNKRTHPLYAAIKAVAAFEKTHGAYPVSPEDCAAAHDGALAASSGANPPRMDLLQALLGDAMEFAPVAAVVGGVVANNIIRAVSGVGAPVKNLVLYTLLGDDSFSGNVMVEDMPLSSK